MWVPGALMVSKGQGPSVGVRSATLSVKQLERELHREPPFEGVTVDTEDLHTPRPRTRADCIEGPRPCPFIGCRHHLFMDVTPAGSIKFNYPGLEPDELERSCSLDVADAGEFTLEEVGRAMNLTRERVRQIEAAAMKRTGLQMREGVHGRAEDGGSLALPVPRG
jgi:hypothetical protein